MAELKRPSTSPHILYYHPKMVRLAKAIVEGCQSWKKTENDEREREKVELKDTIQWEKFPDGWPKIFVQNLSFLGHFIHLICCLNNCQSFTLFQGTWLALLRLFFLISQLEQWNE